MKRTFPVVLVLFLLAGGFDAAARSRAVRHPALPCAFLLSSGIAATVSSEGLSGGSINVIASSPACTSWNAYSNATWVTVGRAGSAVRVDVAPNPTSTPRTATLLIAGIRYELTQEGAAVISPPVAGNLLRNAGFDRDLSFWGWQDRFPNGPGAAAWASLDAGNNPSSGSIRLSNTRPVEQSHTFQQLQCVDIEAGEVYEYGGKIFGTAISGGTAMFGIVEYADENCNVAAVLSEAQTPRPRTAGTWQSESFTKRMGPTSKSAFVVIGSRATTAPAFEVFIDDVFLKRR